MGCYWGGLPFTIKSDLDTVSFCSDILDMFSMMCNLQLVDDDIKKL